LRTATARAGDASYTKSLCGDVTPCAFARFAVRD
jgi:hypothetical protein